MLSPVATCSLPQAPQTVRPGRCICKVWPALGCGFWGFFVPWRSICNVPCGRATDLSSGSASDFCLSYGFHSHSSARQGGTVD